MKEEMPVRQGEGVKTRALRAAVPKVLDLH